MRRWRIPLIAFALGALFCAAVVLLPTLAFRLLRPRLERAVGAPIHVASVTGRLGRVILLDVRVGDLLRAKRITLHYRPARLVLGRIALDPVIVGGATVTLGPDDLR